MDLNLPIHPTPLSPIGVHFCSLCLYFQFANKIICTIFLVESLDLFSCSAFPPAPWLEECLWLGRWLSAELSERTLEEACCTDEEKEGHSLLPTVFSWEGRGKQMSEISLKNQGVLWGERWRVGIRKEEKKKCRWGCCRVYSLILYPKRTGYRGEFYIVSWRWRCWSLDGLSGYEQEKPRLSINSVSK